MPDVIEEWEGHEVTASALDVNIGHGLKEAMRIRPVLLRAGDEIDIVLRAKVKRVGYEPSNRDSKTKEFDYEGPYTRIHVGVPLIVAPVVDDGAGAKAVRKLLDRHAVEVARLRELEGQQSLLNDDEDDEALADKEARLAAEEAAAKTAKKLDDELSR